MRLRKQGERESRVYTGGSQCCVGYSATTTLIFCDMTGLSWGR